MKTIDTQGQLCPAPLILAKKGIQEAAAGETIEILTDNDTAFKNLQNYLTELKLLPQLSQEGEVHILTVIKPESLEDNLSAESFCAAPAASNYVVVLKSNAMGVGEEELGHILMRAFINSLNEADQLPTAILLYNSGVKTALKGTDTALSLQELEDKGVAIFACGTCVEYYGVKELLAVGMISNMYAMTKYMTEAGHIVYP
jgi:selenium metabolism protein YedF